jgi:hypothetical protein
MKDIHANDLATPSAQGFVMIDAEVLQKLI